MEVSRYVVVALIYLMGVLGIRYWRKRQMDPAYFFYLIGWSSLYLGVYVLYLSISYENYYIALPFVCLGLFLCSYFYEKRRLINGLFFNLFIVSFGLYLILLMFQTRDLYISGLLLLLMIPAGLIFIFGFFALILFLYWNGWVVLRKESHALANMLTLFLAIFLTGVLLFQLFVVGNLPNWLAMLYLLVPILLFYLLFVLYNFLTVSILYQFNRPRYRQDYLIVLGAGLIDGERVTPLLAKRIDKAIAFYKAQRRATMKTPKIIMSGGQGSDEKIPEAIAMKNYALSKGIPEEDILVETNSTTTLENMRFSKEIMDAASEKPYHALLTSNNYHIFRAAIYARKAGLKIDGLGAKTAFYFLPNAFLREFVAILMMHKKLHLVIVSMITLLIVFFAAILFFIP
ncbi:hypothetical protein BAU15_04675 [Enterococcus sp. JM4C]|uniref:YdcF family protein n=1 Tax=Candidatus Enterococcus huntleyi TaxID=1857217 RepID=UPI00137AF11A|nr:YdcF family protein [Enterococcus sp. JM4C]KAF1295833.1 hypothetical protein BAU15_04675 [Enterococcus sp. JM4C]